MSPTVENVHKRKKNNDNDKYNIEGHIIVCSSYITR